MCKTQRLKSDLTDTNDKLACQDVLEVVTANQASDPLPHLTYSFRIRKPISDKCAFVQYINDDREWGVGHYLLEALREKAANDCILIISIWMTGKEAEIGGRHFQLYKETVLAALNLCQSHTPKSS